MALDVERVREIAERVAASSGLEIVEVEFLGGGKARMLRVFLDKPAAGADPLAGVTHEDCANFSREFGTILDVEDVMPGSYTLEVSSPGLERRLSRAEEFERFRGSLVKLKTFTAVNNNRMWTGRLMGFRDGVLTLDLAAVKQKGKAKKAAVAETMEVRLRDVEKANLVAEI
jgi:ribosome maturation factor RimP